MPIKKSQKKPNLYEEFSNWQSIKENAETNSHILATLGWTTPQEKIPLKITAKLILKLKESI